MSPGRLNALTDGVVAIVLTIMVLEVRIPAEPTLKAVLDVLPFLAAYLLAFIYVAIYWNNHHHMMQSAHRVTGAVLWANHALQGSHHAFARTELAPRFQAFDIFPVCKYVHNSPARLIAVPAAHPGREVARH